MSFLLNLCHKFLMIIPKVFQRLRIEFLIFFTSILSLLMGLIWENKRIKIVICYHKKLIFLKHSKGKYFGFFLQDYFIKL